MIPFTVLKPLRTIRREKGWKIKDLAAKTGFSRSWLSMIERGVYFPPEWTIKKIADVLEIPYEKAYLTLQYAYEERQNLNRSKA